MDMQFHMKRKKN